LLVITAFEPEHKQKIQVGEKLFQSEVDQKIETKMWLLHVWNDPRLTWNPEEYEGLEYVHLPTTDLWLPDFVLYNK